MGSRLKWNCMARADLVETTSNVLGKQEHSEVSECWRNFWDWLPKPKEYSL